MKRSLSAAFATSALLMSVVLLVSFGFTTIAQQTANPPQPNLVGETIDAKLPSPVLPTYGRSRCSLRRSLTVQGTATGPLPGDVTITIAKLSQDRETNNGVFNANFEVNTSAGKLGIQNDSFERVDALDCTSQEPVAPGAPHQRHFKFKFVTHYNASLPNDRHVCGEATVSGQFGFSQGNPQFEQSFSETINTQTPCK